MKHFHVKLLWKFWFCSLILHSCTGFRKCNNFIYCKKQIRRNTEKVLVIFLQDIILFLFNPKTQNMGKTQYEKFLHDNTVHWALYWWTFLRVFRCCWETFLSKIMCAMSSMAEWIALWEDLFLSLLSTAHDRRA